MIYNRYIKILAHILGRMLLFVKWKRDVIEINLRLCNIPYEKFSLKKFYFQLSMDVLLFLHGRPLKKIHIRSRDVMKFHSLKQNGGVLLTAHFHNWELMGSWLRKNGMHLMGYSKPLKNPFWNYVLNLKRKQIDLPTISENVLKTSLKWVKENKTFGVLWDQRPEAEKIKVPFFKQKVNMFRLPPLLLKAAEKPCYIYILLPDFCIRILQISHENNKHSFQKTAVRYNKILEAFIRKHPEFWYGWPHRRFRNRDFNPYL